ncbi:RNA polymerase sigma factor [Traorella massiliensis]|uniref:RNA polymerase sigma factor n=1 Tax=Traorella massiliensis TaxID=1903263 RepID=UPI0008F932AA|nr:RNA polymerase sigma factor [Traorella massiliensis]
MISLNQSVSTDIDDIVLDQYIKEIANGNKNALADLYAMTSAAVYGFILSILKNSHDAEDILHDCYVSVFSATQNYRSSGRPLAWIMAIARNLCLLKMRERKKNADYPYENWEHDIADRNDVSAEDMIVLKDCMKNLSDEEHQIVYLHAVSGFKHREISQIMELPLSTVLSKYHRALKKLKACLE